MRLDELAAALGARLAGDGSAEITGVAGIEVAGPGEVTFVANPKYAALARTTKAAAVLVEPGFAALETPTLRVDNPYLAFARTIELFYQPPAYPPGIHPSAIVSKSARIGVDAHIGAYVVVMDDVVLGSRAVLLPHAVIYPGVRAGDDLFVHAHAIIRENCRLGDRVTLQNGAIIGADGFGFARDSAGAWRKIPQAGPAVLEDDVEVQALACIDRASIGETRIGAGAKVDNLVQVGHGSSVGENTLLCSQVGLAGSSRVGKNVILAGQVGVAGHLTVGDGVIATAQSGIPSDVAAGTTVSGYPAVDNGRWLRIAALVNKLPELAKRWNRAAAAVESGATEPRAPDAGPAS